MAPRKSAAPVDTAVDKGDDARRVGSPGGGGPAPPFWSAMKPRVKLTHKGAREEPARPKDPDANSHTRFGAAGGDSKRNSDPTNTGGHLKRPQLSGHSLILVHTHVYRRTPRFAGVLSEMRRAPRASVAGQYITSLCCHRKAFNIIPKGTQPERASETLCAAASSIEGAAATACDFPSQVAMYCK